MVELDGTVQEIVFRNETNGFTVAELKSEKSSFTAVGCIPVIHTGETAHLEGEWTEHPDYGRQLKISSYKAVVPDTLNGIENYLASGLIKGIGPVMAAKIVEKFGKDSLTVLEMNPDKLLEIDGIGKSKLETIRESFDEQKDVRDIMVFLQTYGITPSYAVKIYKLYGPETINKIKENPYRLADEVVGIGFKTADKIALSMGIDSSSQYRLTAGTKYILTRQAALNGHTYYPKALLISQAAQLLSAPEELVDEAVTYLAVHQDIILEGRTDGSTAVYLAPYYYAEAGVAKKLVDLSMISDEKPNVDIQKELKSIEKELDISLADKQKEAIEKSACNGVVVITGGPGTGKTTAIKSIIKLLERMGLDVTLAAPTGRAAKRMTEATGMEAKTIHRLLEYGYSQEGGDLFQKNEDNPILSDVIIIDEVSMVDMLLMYHLLKAVPQGSKLILVGDADQLPSVGAGNVLKDIISSGMITVVRLNDIFRQAQQSMIVVNAHKINKGEYPQLNVKDKDFYFERKEQPEDILSSVIELCDRRIPDYFKYDPMRDIQVLTPMKKGIVGVYNLNRELQNVLNPHSKQKNEKQHGDTIFREGDKVMQIKNNYQTEWTKTTEEGTEEGQGVFNGDVGFIQNIDSDEQKVSILFDDDKKVDYDYSHLDELELAYAVSIHKSQGSEFPVVLLPLAGGPPMLMTRNLLYTAVTRAKKLVVIVGREKSIDMMVDNDYITLRYSGLSERIRAVVSSLK